MYQYIWDPETGGLLLTSEQSKFSKEPRPVYYRELDILGFDRYWTYPRDDTAPIMWAEANNYIYRGRTIARTKGGSLYTAPELIVLDESDFGQPLEFVDVPRMVEKNRELMETLVQETIKNIYNTYIKYKSKIDIFYVAFSGGKDSVVALDIVQRALPHDDFIVLFGDTRMEFPDTYDVVDKTEELCVNSGIHFYRASSTLLPSQTWALFGPPATTNRWCCSVHKTSPQIIALRKILNKHDFTGLAFTGVRAEESVVRSEYDQFSEGKKHSGQFSYHTILDWNSAEVFLHIISQKLPLNASYKKGISRAGCLVCPNSTGKHEYLKRAWYKIKVDSFIKYIQDTSGKTNYSQEEMKSFIDSGFWRTRKSGRELNFGQDLFEIKLDSKPKQIIVYRPHFDFEDWGITIGDYYKTDNNILHFKYSGKIYEIRTDYRDNVTIFVFLNCLNSKEDIKFFSLVKGAIIKSLYCIACGVCEAECKNKCIDMSGERTRISPSCIHCHNCQNIHEHCLRYNSIRNKRNEENQMEGTKLDRYFSFGVRMDWIVIYCKYDGNAEFWNSRGDGEVVNKKTDAFKTFVLDAGLAYFDKKAIGDKYTKCIPTVLTSVVKQLGPKSECAWALILCNLVYTDAFYWHTKFLKPGIVYTPELIENLLKDYMPNDTKGLGKRNVISALKIFMATTPLGKSKIFADCDIVEKPNGDIIFNSISRTSWSDPVPEVILYSLFKFAEACGDYYQFTLEILLDDSIERDGVSPTQIFGLDRDTMVRILNGLSVNYPAFISASFTLDLDNITLNSEKTSADVLQLF